MSLPVSGQIGVAIDASNDHLYLDFGTQISEYGSAAEENKLLDATIGEGVLHSSHWITVDLATTTSTPALAPPSKFQIPM